MRAVYFDSECPLMTQNGHVRRGGRSSPKQVSAFFTSITSATSYTF